MQRYMSVSICQNTANYTTLVAKNDQKRIIPFLLVTPEEEEEIILLYILYGSLESCETLYRHLQAWKIKCRLAGG